MARQVRQTLPDPPPVYNQEYIASLARSINHFMGQATALAEVIAAHYIMTDAVRVPADLPDTTDLATGLVYLKEVPAMPVGTALSAGNPAGTSSTTYVMSGLGVTFIAKSTSQAIFTVNGQMGNTGNGETNLTLAYGTGTPPANGAPMTGTLVGKPIRYTGPSNGAYVPFSQTVLIKNLVPGTTYWIGLAVKVTSGTSILMDVDIVGFGLRDTSAYFLTVVKKEDA